MALQAPAPHLQQALGTRMRGVGRQCRGMGKGCVTLVRQTAPRLLEMGAQVLPLAQAAQASLHGATHASADPRAPLRPQLTAALDAHPRIARQSRRLTQGKALAPGTMVHAEASTMAPLCQGKSPGPAPCGRKPGLIAEPAAGCIVARHLPVGHPRAVSAVEPVMDHVEQAITRVRTRPTPALHSLAGDLALHDATLREAWHARGMLSVGIPHTVAPLPPSPTVEEALRLLEEADVHGLRTPSQVDLACACGDSRPVVESVMASLLCRGAGRLTDNGHRGAIVHTGMAVLAHHAATLIRIHAYRLSKRARLFRRRRRLRCRQVSQFNAPINEWPLHILYAAFDKTCFLDLWETVCSSPMLGTSWHV